MDKQRKQKEDQAVPLDRLIAREELRNSVQRLCASIGSGVALVTMDGEAVLDCACPGPAGAPAGSPASAPFLAEVCHLLARQRSNQGHTSLLCNDGAGMDYLIAPVLVADVHWGALAVGPFTLEPEVDWAARSISQPAKGEPIRLAPAFALPVLAKEQVQRITSLLELTAELIGEKGTHRLKEQASRQLLEQSEDALRSLFQAAPVGLTITKERRLVAVNQKLCEICGYAPADLLGRTTRLLYRSEKEYRQIGNSINEQLSAKARTASLEIRLLCRDGSERDVALSIAPLVPGSPETGLATAIQDITERKRFENELRRNQETLQSMFTAMPVGLSVLKDRHLSLVNERLAEITGYQVSELDNMNARRLYESEEEFNRVRDLLYGRLWQEGKSYVETRFRRPDGSIREVALSAAPIDVNDPEAGAAGAVEDITERKAAEAALWESEKRYRNLFEASGNATLLVLDEVILDCNQKALDMFRGSRNTLVGRNLRDITAPLPPDGHPNAVGWPSVPTVAENDQCCQFERLLQRLDATQFHAEVNLSTVEMAGEPCLQAIIRDITSRKAVEKELKESESRFRALYHTNPESVLLIDFEGAILDVNRAFLLDSGYSLEECIGKDFRSFLQEKDHVRILEAIARLRAGVTRRDPIEFSYFTKNGDLLPVAGKGWIVTNEASTPLYLGVFIRNLSKEKALAEEKAALEKQVIQTQKSEAIGTLAGGIAHDFNNILGGIMGYMELALLKSGKEMNPDLQGYLHHALEGCNRAKDLVRQILRFSRHSAMTREPISLAPLIKESIRLLRSALPANIVIQRHIGIDHERILGDPTQMHQVIVNLCTNAYHAMHQTGGTITIRLEPVRLIEPLVYLDMRIEPGEFLKLSVADTGPGIAADVLERIFEPYFTTKGVNEGTGLGLAVTMGIVRSHHGLIEVQTTVGRGTCFKVYLPTTTAEIVRRPTENEGLPHGRGQRILIVDDEIFFQEVVRDSLCLLKYQVTACVSSLKALEAFKADPGGFDLLITDQTMPEMTGTQLIAEIHAVGGSLPVILCTGYSEIISEEHLGGHGITKLLMKPVTIEELARAVSEVLVTAPSAKGTTHAF